MDRAASAARLALEPQIVCHEQPDWRVELLITLAAILAIGLLTALGEASASIRRADDAEAVADRWKARAERSESTATVRLELEGEGFQCRNFNIRPEWEPAVAKECERLAGLMAVARATP